VTDALLAKVKRYAQYVSKSWEYKVNRESARIDLEDACHREEIVGTFVFERLRVVINVAQVPMRTTTTTWVGGEKRIVEGVEKWRTAVSASPLLPSTRVALYHFPANGPI
jgi:hypothetical protein